MIQPFVGPGFFETEDVCGLDDDADEVLLSLGIRANETGLGFSKCTAGFATFTESAAFRIESTNCEQTSSGL